MTVESSVIFAPELAELAQKYVDRFVLVHWLESMQGIPTADRLRTVVTIGEAAPVLAEVFEGIVPTVPAGSIEEAVRTAFAAAGPGGTVLLAPACTSWDQFADYAERCDRFAAAARSLATEVAARG